MSAEKLVMYKGFAIWVARDNEGHYFEITDKLGVGIKTSEESYPDQDAAIGGAKTCIDHIAPDGQP